MPFAVEPRERGSPGPGDEVIAPRLGDIGLPTARVEYHPSSGVTLALPGSYQIVLGNGDNLEAKLKAFEAIRGHLEQTHTVAQVIDVRFLERPYYR